MRRAAQRRAARRASHLDRPQVGRGLVEHAVDVLVAVGAAEALGQLDRLVDRHLVGHVDAVLELVGADHQHAVLDRRQLGGLAVDVAWRARRRASPASAMQPCSSASKCAASHLSKPSCSRMWASITPARRREISHSYRPCSANSRERRRADWAGACRRALAPGRVFFGGRRRLTRGLPAGWPSRPPRARRRGPCPRRGPRPGPRSRRSGWRWRSAIWWSSDDARDAGAALVGDQLEVVGLAADDAAERDQRVEVVAVGQRLQRHRHLERAGHA